MARHDHARHPTRQQRRVLRLATRNSQLASKKTPKRSFSILPPQLQQDLSILHRHSASVEAVMNPTGQENRFTRALAALERLAIQERIPMAIVGGLAAIRYGYPAVTEDIDIAIAKSDLTTITAKAPAYGFRVAWQAETGWHTLEHEDVEINIVPEGRRARDDAPTTIPGPTAMGVPEGVDYADLEHWIELKISSYRRKNQTHVVEVLKTMSPSLASKIEHQLEDVHAEYAKRFRELAEAAKQERQQENGRR